MKSISIYRIVVMWMAILKGLAVMAIMFFPSVALEHGVTDMMLFVLIGMFFFYTVIFVTIDAEIKERQSHSQTMKAMYAKHVTQGTLLLLFMTIIGGVMLVMA